jgi:phosphatidylglycerophosphatase A
VKLWLAQGFGVGRIPKAPGTFGSVVGVGWFLLLLYPGSARLFFLGSLAGAGLSVWLCGAAEAQLHQKDPQSVVIDEIVAIPICFFAFVLPAAIKTGQMPPVASFTEGTNVLRTIGVFLAFRFFDIAKPWPVSQSQSLPAGWGVTIDDVLAAIYVNLLCVILMAAGLKF